MKALLTSGGLTNETLWRGFLELSTREPQDIHIALIDTASKVEKDPSFVDDVIKKLTQRGIGVINRIDIAEPRSTWEKILKEADVIWVEGGNTFHLLDAIKKAGLQNALKTLVGKKLYVGVSAGSILVTPTIAIASVEPADPNDVGLTDFTGLGWVEFEVSPHTSVDVPLKNVEDYANKSGRKLYAYDDNVAMQISDGKIQVIGTGFCKIFNDL